MKLLIVNQLLILIIMLLISCDSKLEERDKEVSIFAIKFINAIHSKKNNVERMNLYYDSSFFAEVTVKEWLNDVVKINKSSGQLLEINLISLEKEYVNFNKRYVFTYQVNFERKATEQTITIIKSDLNYKVIGHSILLK